jgi:hypothetical protein
MHENVMLSQTTIAHAYNLRYIAFRMRRMGSMLAQVQKKKKKKNEKDVISKIATEKKATGVTDVVQPFPSK